MDVDVSAIFAESSKFKLCYSSVTCQVIWAIYTSFPEIFSLKFSFNRAFTHTLTQQLRILFDGDACVDRSSIGQQVNFDKLLPRVTTEFIRNTNTLDDTLDDVFCTGHKKTILHSVNVL